MLCSRSLENARHGKAAGSLVGLAMRMPKRRIATTSSPSLVKPRPPISGTTVGGKAMVSTW